MSHSKPVSILPLSPEQEALLLRNLRSGGLDGSLQVECTLRGTLLKERFEDAWRRTISQHEALRSSIHWKDIDKPVQVVRKEFKTPFEFFDWSGFDENEFAERYRVLKNSIAKAPLDLSASPAMRFAVIRQRESEHRILWTCHHILLDGWSATVVLQDLLKLYSGTEIGEKSELKEYAAWYKNRSVDRAIEYWKGVIEKNSQSTIVGKRISGTGVEAINASIGPESLEKLSIAARESNLTLSTVVHAAWTLAVSSLTNKDKLYVGTTVSGRSIDIPDLDQTAGMFSKVLPVSAVLNPVEQANDWMKRLQSEMASAREFEYFSESEVCALPGISSQLFDSLVVFENIPVSNSAETKLRMVDYKSGLTSAFALTLAVLPVDSLEIRLIFKKDRVSRNIVEWLIQEFVEVLVRFSQDKNSLVSDLRNITSPAPSNIAALSNGTTAYYTEVQNKFEHDIRLIWQEVLEVEEIGLHDNFFDIGGRSLSAVRVFILLKERLNINASPIVLLEHPTIDALAKLFLEDGAEAESWSTIVPLRSKGSKKPVFCLHGGGGHVMFYRPMVSHLSPDQPAFGVQPVGGDGVEKKLETVEEMAEYYIGEIRKTEFNGPYSLLGYCFSSTVCVEMAKQLKAAGDEVGRIIVVDSPPMHMPVDVEEMPGIADRMRSYFLLLRGANWSEIKYRLRYKLRVLGWKLDELKGVDANQMTDPTLTDSQTVLSQAYENYDWQPFDFDIDLVIAGSPDVRPWSRVMIEQWKSLTTGRVNISHLDADHTTVFEEPYVRLLSKVIQDHLDNI